MGKHIHNPPPTTTKKKNPPSAPSPLFFPLLSPESSTLFLFASRTHKTGNLDPL